MSDSPQLAQQAFKKSLAYQAQKKSVRDAALSPSNVQDLIENYPAAKARWRQSTKKVKELGSKQLKYKQSGTRHLLRSASQEAVNKAGAAYNKTLGKTLRGGLNWVLKGLAGPIGSAITAAELTLLSSEANQGEKEYLDKEREKSNRSKDPTVQKKLTSGRHLWTLENSDIATYYMNTGTYPQGAFNNDKINPNIVIEMIREWSGHDAFAQSKGMAPDGQARTEQSLWGQAAQNWERGPAGGEKNKQ